MRLLPKLPIDKMSVDEIERRLKDGLNSGRIGEDKKNAVLGFFSALKRAKNGGKGPTLKHANYMRAIVRGLRNSVVEDDAPLIDREDKPVTVSPRPTNTREAWNPELWK